LSDLYNQKACKRSVNNVLLIYANKLPRQSPLTRAPRCYISHSGSSRKGRASNNGMLLEALSAAGITAPTTCAIGLSYCSTKLCCTWLPYSPTLRAHASVTQNGQHSGTFALRASMAWSLTGSDLLPGSLALWLVIRYLLASTDCKMEWRFFGEIAGQQTGLVPLTTQRAQPPPLLVSHQMRVNQLYISGDAWRHVGLLSAERFPLRRLSDGCFAQ
jgi:hypothetical protein